MSNLCKLMSFFEGKRAVLTKKWAMSLVFFVSTAFFVGLTTQTTLAFAENAAATPVKSTVFVNTTVGKNTNLSVSFKNTGARVWKKDQIFLETGDFLRSFSKLQSVSWLRYYRLAGLTNDIKPGQTAVFNFEITAPAGIIGDLQQNLQLVENDQQPIKGSVVRLFVNIANAVAVAPTPVKTVAVKPVTTATRVVAKNVITQPISTIYNTSSITTPKTTTGVSSFLCSATGVVTSEQIAALADCNTSSNEVDPTNGQTTINTQDKTEPMMRIGLFSTTDAQPVSQESVFDVYAGGVQLFSGVSAGTVVTVAFSSTTKQYSATLLGMTKYTVSPVRIVPRTKNSVATLLNYRNTPTGSGTTRDNRFRNIIEFQYSTKTKNFWVINELPLDYYLKGLGETSNASPVEFQKVMLAAARTYAMYHYNRGVDNKIPDGSTKHADEHFHLDSTYDQVYRGYSSELRNLTLVQAENETRGMVISYQGKVIVTPYFSRSDGRTRSYQEVWGGTAMPWLVGVPVPQDAGQTLWGHGVGMSARGALLMVVNEAKKWDAVIKYFYTGVDILKVY